MLPDNHRCTAGRDTDSQNRKYIACFAIEGRPPVQRQLQRCVHSLCAFLISRDIDMTNGHFDMSNLTRNPWFAKKPSEGLWINWVSHPYYTHIATGGPLNVRFTLFNGEFHAHLLNWPKCIVWLCLIRQTAGFSPCGHIVPASLLLGFKIWYICHSTATCPFWE